MRILRFRHTSTPDTTLRPREQNPRLWERRDYRNHQQGAADLLSRMLATLDRAGYHAIDPEAVSAALRADQALSAAQEAREEARNAAYRAAAADRQRNKTP
jgi:hypothetical protein